MATAQFPQAVRVRAAAAPHRRPLARALRTIGVIADTAVRVVLLGQDGMRT